MTTTVPAPPAIDPILASMETALIPAHTRARSETSQERLLRALEAHAAAEADSLSEYETLAETSGDPVVAMLMRFIVEDEERHHRLLEQMATCLRDGLAWTHSPDALPTGSHSASGDVTAAVEATRSLIREEREGARYVRHLARQEPHLHSGLFSLILEMIGQDSVKHEHLLRYILRRLEGRGAA
jgi:hypothetical protein